MYVVPSLTSSYGIWKDINVLCTMFHNPSWVWVTKKVHWGEVVSSTRSFQLLLWETLQARLLVQGRKYRVGSSTIQQYKTYIVRIFYTRLILRVRVPIFFFDSDSTNIEHQKPHQQKSKQTSLSLLTFSLSKKLCLTPTSLFKVYNADCMLFYVHLLIIRYTFVYIMIFSHKRVSIMFRIITKSCLTCKEEKKV